MIQESPNDSPSTTTSHRTPERLNRPRICLIDVQDDSRDQLAKRFNCSSGSLGPLVETDNTSPRSYQTCLLNCFVPHNLHEHDIVAIDLQDSKRVPYVGNRHVHKQSKGQTLYYYVSSYPEQLFDPRAAAAQLIQKELAPLRKKLSVVIVFASPHEEIAYHLTEVRTGQSSQYESSLYAFYIGEPTPTMTNMSGIDTELVPSSPLFTRFLEFRRLMERHNDAAEYTVTFAHPDEWQEATTSHVSGWVKSPNFFPLMVSGTGKIVSFAQFTEHNATFLFPKIRHKASFLFDFVDTVLPLITPALFPYHDRFSWISDARYRLPGESRLLCRRSMIEKEYNDNIQRVNKLISENQETYSYLHDLLTQTGPDLVRAVKRFLEWMGFEEVIDADRDAPEVLEEDLRIANSKGLLLMEVKGLGGTSTDADCSQIGKIRYRRIEDTKSFEVYALYVVNHQRFLPPSHRRNPPFSQNQLQDAINEKRGLVTTLDLFNLFFNVENGHVKKEHARDSLYSVGLIRFVPSGAAVAVRPRERHYSGYVAIIDLSDLEVRPGDEVVFDVNDRYASAVIEDVQIEGESVESADSGEVGLRFSKKLESGATLWLMRGDA